MRIIFLNVNYIRKIRSMKERNTKNISYNILELFRVIHSIENIKCIADMLRNGEKMKTNCKTWKYLLGIAAIVATITVSPMNTLASDAKVTNTERETQKQTVTTDKMDSANMTAGAGDLLDADISMENEDLIALAKSKTLPIAEQEKEEKPSTLVMAKVNEYVNIRTSANQDAEKVGVLYKDCGGDIIEQQGEWTKIKSGDVTGWVRNEYLYFGEEATAIAEEVGILMAYSNTETLRVREAEDLESKVLGLLANGEAVEAIESEGDWITVSYEGTTGYVASEFVDIEFNIDKAESMEEIRARKAAEEEAKRNAQKEAVLATASELEILAALIQCEAGGESYEGQIAVGAVVMNRVRCAAYPNTITEVIYASGQFVPASKGKMETLILTGTTKASCRQAAQEVINGACNIGDALHFRRVNGRAGYVIGNHVFW